MPTWRDEYDFKVPKNAFRLITGRYVMFTHSATTNNIMLRDIMKTNHIWINNNVAKELSIKEGDKVEVKSSVATVELLAYPTNKIAPNVIFFSHGFGISSSELEQAFGNGASDNQLIEDKMENIYGCATMNETNVYIRKL